MKRTNVVLDEELLENARRALGEKTYSGTITKALEKLVRQEKFWAAYRKFEELAHGEGVFDPEYVAEKTRKSVIAQTRSRKRVSAHEARVPATRRKPRGAR
jgi:intergrase/recombinase